MASGIVHKISTSNWVQEKYYLKDIKFDGGVDVYFKKISKDLDNFEEDLDGIDYTDLIPVPLSRKEIKRLSNFVGFRNIKYLDKSKFKYISWYLLSDYHNFNVQTMDLFCIHYGLQGSKFRGLRYLEYLKNRHVSPRTLASKILELNNFHFETISSGCFNL